MPALPRSRGPYASPPALDPGLRAAARFLPRGARVHWGLRVQRFLTDTAMRATAKRDITTVPISPGVGVRVHHPGSTPSAPGPAVLWIHGGGTLFGSAHQDDAFCARLAEALGASVVAVEYRLAPEHPYPAPLEDCYTALAWLERQPWTGRIAVSGGSAGGLLAASVALLARDRGDIEVAAQALVYPMLDDRSPRQPDGHPRIMWSERDNRLAWDHYLRGTDRATALVPARRAELPDDDPHGLAGLPPAWIGVGDLDLFLDEDTTYATALEAAGVPVSLHIAPGAFHAFDQVAPRAAVTTAFFESLARFLRTHLSRATPAP
ncbi:alpha/beta hydrolase [Nocardioides acrostichi]|uniref:Alpha/beta hydrolase n=1 Tax=Nocardioides acrostichi TaxID=2784339 RepID=A0A930UYI6_9ACTN|nr:alpha/beta hydrolase [Nocardioides acrostichi]MBF4161410.1 alpha/beta hydrolase [Nocardioides acrostichi]